MALVVSGVILAFMDKLAKAGHTHLKVKLQWPIKMLAITNTSKKALWALLG